MARNQVAKKDYDETTGIVTFDFADATKTHLAFDLASLMPSPEAWTALPEIVRALACHGAGQKIGDEYSGSGGDLAEAVDAARGMIERLVAGEWSKERTAGGDRPSLVAEGVIRHAIASGLGTETGPNTGGDWDATRAKYVGKGGEENRKNAMKNKQVAAHVEAIKAERAAERAKAAQAAAAADTTGGTVLI